MNKHEALECKRNKELMLVKKLDPQFSCQGVVGEFISLYIQSEVFANKLQRYYRTDVKKSGKNEIYTPTLKAAIKHFNLHFKDSDISLLFKGAEG